MPACDAILVSGGSSQGEKDITAEVIGRAAKPGVFTHGLAIKPGKPTILGWDDESKTLLAGLPGHPVSAMMVFEIIFGWLSDKLFGKSPPFPIPARISCKVPGSPGKTVCQPVILHLEEGGFFAEPVFGKSGMITTLTGADGYIIIDLNKEGLKKDELVLVDLL
jgi:molybdopterin molybdotransferase